jgi:hypothetical protein
MKTFLYYCFYRISKAYKFWDDVGFCIYGSFLTFFPLGSLFLSLLALTGAELDKGIIYTVVGIVSVASIAFIDGNRYKMLEKKYKEEKHRKLKGWLVFLYVVGSLMVYVVSLLIAKTYAK